MNRTTLLILGIISWTIAGVDVLIHLLIGDLVVPVGMAIALILWVSLRSDALFGSQKAVPQEESVSAS